MKASLSLLYMLLCCLFVQLSPVIAQENETPPHHALIMLGEPMLSPDFKALPYANPDAPKGGRVNLGFPGTFDSLNPYNVKAGSSVLFMTHLVFQTLMSRNLDEPFTLYPQVAESVDVDAARSYVTFHLNPKAHFSDGVALKSSDVRFTFNLLKAQGRPQHRLAFAKVKSVETPDAHTITFRLNETKDRELPLIIALMPIFPEHAMDAAHFSEASLAIPIGSGPYKLISVTPGTELMFEKDPNWWGKDLPITKGFYNFDILHVMYFRDMNSLFEAFKAGLVDLFEEGEPMRWLTAYQFPALLKGDVVKEVTPIGRPKGMQGFVFNTRHAIFSNIRVREALMYMFDFEWLNAKLFGGLYVRTKSFFDESILSAAGRPADARERALLASYPDLVRADIMEGTWHPPVSDGSGRDRENARKALDLLKQAGWELQGQTLSTKGQPFEFEILVNDRAIERLGLLYAQSLARIGIKANVRMVDDVQYQRRRQNFDYDMILGTWPASASPGNEQRGRWGSQSATQPSSFNFAGVQSPAIDAIIEALVRASTLEEYQATARALDRLLLSGFWIIPFYHAEGTWIAYWKRIAHPPRPAHFGLAPFGSTLETFWRAEPVDNLGHLGGSADKN